MAEQPARRPRRPPERPSPPDAEAAFEIATRFLATRPRTRWEVERRLKRAGAEPAVTARALERLVSLGFVDDEAFARWWIEQRDRHAPRGRRLIEAELRQHGVGGEAIEALRYAAAHEEPGGASTEQERAAQALVRHLRGRPMPVDPKAVKRIGMFLVRRGFGMETVWAVLRESQEAG